MAQTIYDLLTGVKIDDATVTQLDTATGRTFVDRDSIEFWQGIITLSKVVEAARTYPHGLPVPEASALVSQAVAPSDSVYWQPSGSEIWAIQGIQITAAGGTPSCSVELFNGADTCIMHRGDASTTASSFFPWESPFLIDSSVYIRIANADGSNAHISTLAYNKVSL